MPSKKDKIKAEKLKDLGLRIRDLRKSQNLKQSDLAANVNKDQQSIQRLEKGGMNPTYFYLLEIADGLNTTISELLDFEPSKKKKK